MGIFCGTTEYHTENCIYCTATFALNMELYRQRRKDGKGFYCPACGKSMVYRLTETDEERKLREAKQELQAANARAIAANGRAERITKQYRRVRDRVKNGVCPCCTRSFGNLAEHMRSQHPDFGHEKQLRALREAFGLTQSDLAAEVGVSVAQIGDYEHGRRVSNRHAQQRIQSWMEAQAA